MLLIGKHSTKLRIAARRGIETTTPKQAAKRSESLTSWSKRPAPRPVSVWRSISSAKGQLVLKSTFHGKTELDAARIVVDEITIVGSRCGRFAPALDLLKKGAVDVDSLISEEYPLAKGVHAMRRAGDRGVLKVLLRP